MISAFISPISVCAFAVERRLRFTSLSSTSQRDHNLRVGTFKTIKSRESFENRTRYVRAVLRFETFSLRKILFLSRILVTSNDLETNVAQAIAFLSRKNCRHYLTSDKILRTESRANFIRMLTNSTVV